MTDREKLIELLQYGMDKYFLLKFEAEIFANLLISHGVTFAKDTDVPSKWISVEDRLPKDIANKVIVRCKNGYIGLGHYEDFQGDKDWYNLESGKPFWEWDLDGCVSYEVTHWMPLPQPPMEE